MNIPILKVTFVFLSLGAASTSSVLAQSAEQLRNPSVSYLGPIYIVDPE